VLVGRTAIDHVPFEWRGPAAKHERSIRLLNVARIQAGITIEAERLVAHAWEAVCAQPAC